MIWTEEEWLTSIRLSKSDEYRSKVKLNNSNHSTRPFNWLKSSKPWMTTRSPSQSSKKGSPQTSRQDWPTSRLRRDLNAMVSTNWPKRRVSIGLWSCFINWPVPSPYCCGQVVCFASWHMLYHRTIQVTCIWVSCCSLLTQWLGWWVSIRTWRVKLSWVALKISFRLKPLLSEVGFRAKWMPQNLS